MAFADGWDGAVADQNGHTRAAQGKRETLAERLADYLLTHGLDAASLRPLASGAGLSDRMLIYYFGTRDAAIEAGLLATAARLEAQLDAQRVAKPLAPSALADHLERMVLDDRFDLFMALWFDVVARAARGQVMYRRIAHLIGSRFAAWIGGQLASEGAAPVEQQALDILARIDGLAQIKAAGLLAGAQPPGIPRPSGRDNNGSAP